MPKLLFLVTEDWWFCRHFLPMARAARADGLAVVVATRVRDHAAPIAAEGCKLVPLENARGSLALADVIGELMRMVRLVRAERPDIVHCIGLRMVVLGGLAAKLAGARALVLAPTGLGHLWIENGIVERALRPVLRLLIGRVLRGRKTRFLFENEDDPRELGLDPNSDEVTLIGGAGVDPAQFVVAPEPSAPPVMVAVVSRMLRSKGIAEAVAATQRARQRGAPVELHLYGAPDPSNRNSLTAADLNAWSATPGLSWHGSADDVAQVYRTHHIAMLLSYREGLPRTLVEAAACGRPIVATDVPGCRALVPDGEEGILVPLGDIEATAEALVRLAGDARLRVRMGAAAHAHFRRRFTEEAVRQTITTLYRAMLGR